MNISNGSIDRMYIHVCEHHMWAILLYVVRECKARARKPDATTCG